MHPSQFNEIAQSLGPAIAQSATDDQHNPVDHPRLLVGSCLTKRYRPQKWRLLVLAIVSSALATTGSLLKSLTLRLAKLQPLQ
jgi:hypothetical protein